MNKRTTPNERLRLARERAGFASATDAARAKGWNVNSYKSHENGVRGLKPNIAETYGKGFRVSPGWLLTGENPPKWQIGASAATPTNLALRTVPLLPHTAFHQEGEAVRVKTSHALDRIPMDDDATISADAYAVEITDDSMIAPAPSDGGFRRGDVVVVDPDARLSPGDYVLALPPHEERVVVRRYRVQKSPPDAVVDLVPINPDFPITTLSGPALGAVLGRVCRHIRKL